MQAAPLPRGDRPGADGASVTPAEGKARRGYERITVGDEADGITFAGLRRLADIPRCDVICVPGGFGATDNAIGDEELLRELRRLAASARYVTSVCTGSLVLGAAGLLRGRLAACHWAWRDFLTSFGAVPETARVVRDGNVITGGGVTAGIDFALTVVAELAEQIRDAIEAGDRWQPD